MGVQPHNSRLLTAGLKAVAGVAILLAVAVCSDSTSLSLPSRMPDHEGPIMRREQYGLYGQILIDLAPEQPVKCPRDEAITAVFYSVGPRTYVVRRSVEGALRIYPADSLLPGMRVRVWRDNLPSLDTCPPILSPEAIEVVG